MAHLEEMAHVAQEAEYLIRLMDNGLTREQAEAQMAEEKERYYEEMACIDPDCVYPNE